MNTSGEDGGDNFTIPGSSISILVSDHKARLSQVELDLCVIEGYATILDQVLARSGDGDLPLNSWAKSYGNVVINLEDFCPPTFRMTYSVVAAVLRSIALYTSQRGYYEMQVEVWNNSFGHVGTGEY